MKIRTHHTPLPPPDRRTGLIDTTVAEDNWTPDGVQAYLLSKYGNLPKPRKRTWRGYDVELSTVSRAKHEERRRAHGQQV